ncbi:MAG: hypothetical protein NTU44_05600 [Bacteroidetes bacterium]|nr:hypothetical protein [Bacteroidota bacterium]
MRQLAFILGLYVLALTILPCVDEGYGKESSRAGMCRDNSRQQQEDSDYCSPFCNCNCCGLPMITHSADITFSVFMVPSDLIVYYLSGKPSSYSPPSWHPPKTA